MKTDENQMAFIGFLLFFGIEAFQWVTRGENSIFSVPQAPRQAQSPFPVRAAPSACRDAGLLTTGIDIDDISDFVKTFRLPVNRRRAGSAQAASSRLISVSNARRS